ncbi:MAG: thiamine phosphate synthase [Deltaproteobacteria bacterium]|nr:thiamine phosphate synthase [Deltaproteobacteria bacterium]
MIRGTLPSLYLITDMMGLGDEHLLRQVKGALDAGVRLVQLREKLLEGRALLHIARSLRGLTSEYGASLIVNDRLDIALLSNADGVHLGQSGFPPGDARKIIGSDKLIGVSTHGLDEAMAAEQEGADFITFGPVYETRSKAAYGAPVGIDALKAVCAATRIPVYAIGGIKNDNAAEVLQNNASGVALISAIMAAPDAKEAAGRLLYTLKTEKIRHDTA